MPPFAAAFGFCLVTAYISDKIALRYPFVLLSFALTITGLAILMTVHGHAHFSAEYAALCLVAMGSFGSGISLICWYLMNLNGHIERSIGSAWIIGFGNIGGIVATFAFVKKDGPLYHTGYSLNMALASVGIVASLVYGSLIWAERRASNGAGLDSEGKPTVVL